MSEVAMELSTRCLNVAKILSTLLDCDMSCPGKKLPPMCLIYGMIIFLRCHHLSMIQRINTVLLTTNKHCASLGFFSLFKEVFIIHSLVGLNRVDYF